MKKEDFIKYKLDVEKEFNFLEKKYKFTISEKINENDGFTIIYKKNKLKVYLYYSFKENLFYFNLIRGKNTIYPNDSDFSNIKSFQDLIKKNEVDFNLEKLQPDVNNYIYALKENVKKLKKYGDSILRENNWF